MPSAQQFLELLVGDDAVSALSLRTTDTTLDRETAHPTKSRKWGAGATMNLQNEGPYSCGSDNSGPSSENQIVTDSELDIHSILQMTGDELCRQPALLHMQTEKIANTQDELAVQNCSLFLASSKALNSLRCSVEGLSRTLAEMERCVQPLQTSLKQFRAASNESTGREASLHILVSMNCSVSELIELPSLVLTCCNGGLYDEMVDVLLFADEQIAALRAKGCNNMRLLDFLESQLKEARRICVKAMLRQFGQQPQLAASIKLIGPLRRLSCSEAQLRTQFLQRRDGDIVCQRRNAEAVCETEPAHGLCAAAELLRLGVLHTAIHYRAIFGVTDGPLSAWLAEQVHWFVKLVRQELLQGTRGAEALGASDSEGAAFEPVALEAVSARTHDDGSTKFRVTLMDLATVFRQANSAACALRRVQCFFFPAVAITLNRYAVTMHRRTIEEVAAAFEQSMDEYDYAPSMVYFSLLEETPWFQACLSANPCCLFLLRHAPLSNLYNSIATMLNSFQECSIFTAAPDVINLLEGLLVFCIRKLISLKPGKRHEFESEIRTVEEKLIQRIAERENTKTQEAEFFVMCDIFAYVLLPCVSRHISATFPPHVHLSSESLCALMEEAELLMHANPFVEACTAVGRQPATSEDTPTLASAAHVAQQQLAS